jgi:hypothetical protein
MPGRPTVTGEIRKMVRTMASANPLWGAPRVHGELLKLDARRTNKGTPKQEVIKYILTHGPTPRKQLISGARLPLGTVSYLLNDKKTFRRLDDGRWDVTDAVRNVGH